MHNKQSAWCIFSILILVALFGVVGAIPSARAGEQQRPAGTDIQGAISTNTTWDSTGSPYNLTSEVQVYGGTTLTVMPGTVINGNGKTMVLFGILNVQGTANSKVILNSLTVRSEPIGPNRPNVVIRHAEIHGGSPFNGYGSMLSDSYLTDGAVTAIDNNASVVVVERNVFYKSGGINISNNYHSSFYVRNNVFLEQTSQHAILVHETIAPSTTIEYNSFLSTDRIAFAFEVSPYASGATIVNNYWGTQDTNVIKSMIYDKTDDPNSSGIATYAPFLTAPDPNTPVFELPTPTPTSTVTPTATSTSTATPTVVSPPQCPISDVSVLPNAVYYTTSSGGQFFLIAEFCNATDKSVKQVSAKLRFYNAANEEIEASDGPNSLSANSNYAPGARWCVKYFLPTMPLNMVRVEIDSPIYAIDGHTQTPLALLDVSINLTDHSILGRIRNDYAATIRGLQVRAAIYDSMGRITGCDGASVNNTTLTPKQATTFSAGFPNYGAATSLLYADYAGYHIWADALDLDKLPIFLPQTVRQIAPTATNTPFPTPTATPMRTPGPPSLVGPRGVLKVNANPVNPGSTIYATWSIPNFRDGEFDRGDGAGFKGPIGSTMTVDIPNVTTSRYVTLRWRDTTGQQLDDTLLLQVVGSTAPVPTSANRGACNVNDPNWRGSDPAYTFCVAKDFNWTDGGGEIRNFSQGQDFTLSASWDIYGISGIWFLVEPSGQVCGPSGTVTINRQTVGTGQESFNIKDLPYGGYKAHLRVKRSSDGVEVDYNYNERFLCIGTSPATVVSTVLP